MAHPTKQMMYCSRSLSSECSRFLTRMTADLFPFKSSSMLCTSLQDKLQMTKSSSFLKSTILMVVYNDMPGLTSVLFSISRRRIDPGSWIAACYEGVYGWKWDELWWRIGGGVDWRFISRCHGERPARHHLFVPQIPDIKTRRAAWEPDYQVGATILHSQVIQTLHFQHWPMAGASKAKTNNTSFQGCLLFHPSAVVLHIHSQ